MTLTELIAEQEQKIAAATIKLNYYKALDFLQNLENTATFNVAEPLVDRYGRTASFFQKGDLTGNDFSKDYYTWVLNLRIDSYKIKADTKKLPTWAKEAKKAAALVDQYNADFDF